MGKMAEGGGVTASGQGQAELLGVLTADLANLGELGRGEAPSPQLTLKSKTWADQRGIRHG